MFTQNWLYFECTSDTFPSCELIKPRALRWLFVLSCFIIYIKCKPKISLLKLPFSTMFSSKGKYL